MIIVYLTCRDEAEAKKVAQHLLDRKLIACANMWPIRSMYRWEGKMNDETETALIVKSMPEKYDEIAREVKKVHSYSVPCIAKISAEANAEYGDWVKKEVGL